MDGESERAAGNWDSLSAATEAGFVCLVRPTVDPTLRHLYLGEVFTPISAVSKGRSLFLPLRHHLQKALMLPTRAYSVQDPFGRSLPGPRISGEAIATYDTGYELLQDGVANVRYRPQSIT